MGSHFVRVARRLMLVGITASVVTGLFASSAAAVSQLTVEPEAVDFGVVLPGEGVSQTVTVRNLGPDPVELSEIYLAGDVDPFYFVGGSCPESGTFTDECQLTLEFAPDAEGDFEAMLVVEGGPDDEPAVAKISAKSREPGRLVPDLAAVDFGLVPMGSTSASRTVRFTNDGGVPIRIEVARGNGPATITGGNCGSGGIVEPLGSCDVVVAFRPFSWALVRESATQMGELAVRAELLDWRPPQRWEIKVPVGGTAASDQGLPLPTRAELAQGIEDDLERIARSAVALARRDGRSAELSPLRRAPFGMFGTTVRVKGGKQWIPLGSATAVVQPEVETRAALRWATTGRKRLLKRLLKQRKSVVIESVARYRASDRTIKEVAKVRVKLSGPKAPAKKAPAKKQKRKRR